MMTTEEAIDKILEEEWENFKELIDQIDCTDLNINKCRESLGNSIKIISMFDDYLSYTSGDTATTAGKLVLELEAWCRKARAWGDYLKECYHAKN